MRKNGKMERATPERERERESYVDNQPFYKHLVLKRVVAHGQRKGRSIC